MGAPPPEENERHQARRTGRFRGRLWGEGNLRDEFSLVANISSVRTRPPHNCAQMYKHAGSGGLCPLSRFKSVPRNRINDGTGGHLDITLGREEIRRRTG